MIWEYLPSKIMSEQQQRYISSIYQPSFSAFANDNHSRKLIQNLGTNVGDIQNQNRYSLSLMTWNDPLEAWFSIKAFHLSKKCNKTHNKRFFAWKKHTFLLQHAVRKTTCNKILISNSSKSELQNDPLEAIFSKYFVKRYSETKFILRPTNKDFASTSFYPFATL